MHDMQHLYGEDQVVFLKVNGDEIYEVSRKYQVMSFPTFVYVQPNSRGLKANQFQDERTYESMKAWMISMLKDVPQKNPAAAGAKVAETEHVQETATHASGELHELQDEHPTMMYGGHQDHDIYGDHRGSGGIHEEEIISHINELGVSMN